jgi:hypothetical protein
MYLNYEDSASQKVVNRCSPVGFYQAEASSPHDAPTGACSVPPPTPKVVPCAASLNVPALTLASIHPSGSWPWPGHPDAMKMSCRQKAIFTRVAHRSASDHRRMKMTEQQGCYFSGGGRPS